jgi:hypothetical protein
LPESDPDNSPLGIERTNPVPQQGQAAALPGHKLFVVDEEWRHCSPRSVPPELLAVVKTGRKVGLQSVFLTQEPRELN